MAELFPWYVANALTLLLLAAVCGYLQRAAPTPGVRAFSVGFALGGLSVLFGGMSQLYPSGLLDGIGGLFYLVSSAACAVGGFRTAGRTVPRVLNGIWGVGLLWLPVAVASGVPFEFVISPLILVMTCSLVVAGVAIVRAETERPTAWLAGTSLAAMGLSAFTYPILAQFPDLLYLGFLCAMLIDVTVGISLVMNAFERARDELLAKEKELADARRMEAIGRLAGGVAHDFNNLLTIIMGNLSVIETLTDDEEVLELVDISNTATDQASRLTAQLLALGRTRVWRPAPIDVHAAVDETLRVLARIIPENVELRVEGLPGPTWVETDRGAIEQLLVNLVANARDALPSGGTIHLRASVTGDQLSLEVADDGIGMDAETLQRVFEPFYTTKEMGRGTGLGMASVHALVEQMAGTISIESTPGTGTVVRVVLPVLPSASQPAAVDEPVPSAHVLLVEDEEAVRQVGALALKRAGHTVTTAADGAEALEILGRGMTFDIVVSDMVMPRVGGLELVRVLTRQSPDTAILLVSGHPRTDSLPSDIDFLAKPFTSEQLNHAVARCLQGRPSLERTA